MPARELLLLKCLWEVLHPGQRTCSGLESRSLEPETLEKIGGGVGEGGGATRPPAPAARRTSRPPLSQSRLLCSVLAFFREVMRYECFHVFGAVLLGERSGALYSVSLPQHTNPLAISVGIRSARDPSEARFPLNTGSSCGLIPMQVGFRFFCISAFLSQEMELN